jgi:hypothetical protein
VLVLGLCLLVTSVVVGQNTSDDGVAGARAALLHFIELSNRKALRSPEARTLLVGEAAKWDTDSFGNLAPNPDTVVVVEKGFAVGRIQWHGENNYVADFYFYLGYFRQWKIGAMRRLALTGIVEMAYNGLKSRKTLTTEEQDQLSNLELVLASDEALRAWFAKQQRAMNALAELTHSMRTAVFISPNQQNSDYPEIRKLLAELHLDGLEVHEDGNVEVTIGGVTDNSVGFIYSPSNHPPQIEPNSYIWVEKVADKWFLFRTT